MGTTIRADISKSNPYWLPKHRYYELKHFCLQYPEWKKLYLSTDPMAVPYERIGKIVSENRGNTESCAEARLACYEKMHLIDECCRKADPYLANYILKGVTTNLGYTYLKTKLEMPCSKDMYYDRYRRFFWFLNDARK